MKKFITIILPLLAAFAKAESEDICWSMVKGINFNLFIYLYVNIFFFFFF